MVLNKYEQNLRQPISFQLLGIPSECSDACLQKNIKQDSPAKENNIQFPSECLTGEAFSESPPYTGMNRKNDEHTPPKKDNSDNIKVPSKCPTGDSIAESPSNTGTNRKNDEHTPPKKDNSDNIKVPSKCLTGESISESPSNNGTNRKNDEHTPPKKDNSDNIKVPSKCLTGESIAESPSNTGMNRKNDEHTPPKKDNSDNIKVPSKCLTGESIAESPSNTGMNQKNDEHTPPKKDNSDNIKVPSKCLTGESISESPSNTGTNRKNDEHTPPKKDNSDNIKVPSKCLTSEAMSESTSVVRNQEDGEEKKENSDINIQFAIGGGTRDYTKAHECFFCGKAVIKMARHLEKSHGDNPEIAQLPTVPKTDADKKQRKFIFDKYRRMGDFNHNIEVLQNGKGTLYVGRRPTDPNASPQEYLPCQFCLNFYIKAELWRHTKTCGFIGTPLKDENAELEKKRAKECIAAGRYLIQGATGAKALGFQADDIAFQQDVLHRMHNDDVSRVVKSDPLILLLGKAQYAKLGSRRAGQVREKIRLLGRLKTKMRDLTGKVSANLEEFLKPECFDMCAHACKLLAVPSEKALMSGADAFLRPSVALKVGQLLKRMSILKRGQAIRTGDIQKRTEATDFIDLHQGEWADKVSGPAKQSISEQHYNRKEILPLTGDLIKLTVSCIE